MRCLLAMATVLAIALCSCSDAVLQPKASSLIQNDDRLTLHGNVCTSPPNPSGFPVKVVFIIDQSGSMCVSDPPGSQENNGFCQQVGSVIAPGITEPGRVRALKKLILQFKNQPNVQVSLVPFETNVKGVWPPATGIGASRFARPDSSLDARINSLQSELGKGTDYQGALSYAYGLISSDIAQTETTSPEVLPRTRYVVVFLTDGTPFPRCSANDNLSVYADATHPDLTWADSSGSGNFCNTIDPMDPDAITGFIKGTDRNQNYQLYSYVDQIMELKSQHNIGDIRIHTVLLFNQAAVAACGPICQDLYGTYPNTPPAQYPAAAKAIASYILRQFADRGNGVYQEFVNGDIANLGLGALDYSSLAARNVMKTLFVKAMSSAPGVNGRVVDSDGDGLPDDVDNGFTNKTNPFFTDSDQDGFDDAFEVSREDHGFRPDVKDGRGCDPKSPLSPGCFYDRDTDGDGLTEYQEAYLNTRSTIVDSDGDGIPDGIEAHYGLDPLKPQGAGLDTDGDGISDLQEILQDSNPISRDRDFIERYGYQYQATPQIQADGRVCYDFSVSNLQMVTPPPHAGFGQGYNLFKVYFAEAPESGVSTDYGVWRAACAWAQYDPPSVRVPAGPDLSLADGNFKTLRLLNTATQYQTGCVGVHP